LGYNIFTDIAGVNQALFQITHGLYILTAFKDKPNGQCLDACMQVTNTPPRIAIGVGKRSLTHEMISATGLFVINVLDQESEKCYDLVKLFGFKSGREINKLENIEYETTDSKIPILNDAKAFFECKVQPEKTIDLKTHTLFIADVIKAGTHNTGEPLTYNEYRKKIKGHL